MIQRVHDRSGTLLGLVVPADFARLARPGVTFLTDADAGQQLGFLSHPAGKVIEAHAHPPARRIVTSTCEVLFLRKGRLRADFYDATAAKVESLILAPGDVALLVGGGHGFEVLEDAELFEVKQGPYVGEFDKVRLSPRMHEYDP